MLAASQGHFAIISLKVRKLQRELERSVSTVYCRSNDDRKRNIRSDDMYRTAADRLFSAHYFQSYVVP